MSWELEQVFNCIIFASLEYDSKASFTDGYVLFRNCAKQLMLGEGFNRSGTEF